MYEVKLVTTDDEGQANEIVLKTESKRAAKTINDIAKSTGINVYVALCAEPKTISFDK